MINIRLIDADRLKYAFQLMKDLDLDGSKEVVIRDYKSKRSLEQNALYWRWLEVISEQTGYSVDELHNRFKRLYMLQVYLAEPKTKKQQDWIGLYDMIKEDGTNATIERALDTISTTWADVEQFKEYMDRIEQFCISKEIHLPA
jgi:hypothetical protein